MFKKLMAYTHSGNTLLGDVVTTSASEKGMLSSSHFEWRVKRTLDGGDYLIGIKMKPDGSVGAEGSAWNYINFDLETAIRIRDRLNDCITTIEQARDKK
ncbi:hypothetical protein [Rhizobium sp. RU36D]|uniref:hypothetical protein n=1 Tax=Rhizobium sp. RU36D TaxID=1907415 RepID=UPI0009D7E88D|nr:hypothetical protein [Rhizobium sp. RU36D]SMC82751.1 hypothetical protein SAMN05880593_107231 [Rhizobium sp. RU36D]